MRWVKRNTGTNVLEVISTNSGLSEAELLSPTTVPPDSIENLPEAAQMIQNAIKARLPISVMGDYDCDGVTATAILSMMFNHLGVTPVCRLPKRMSEGYGLSPAAITEFKPGLLVTVDNGIAAIEAIKLAKDNGFKVIVLDHHLPGEVLPEADIIVDPHVNPEANGFTEYCGAGLAYKLAQYLLDDESLLNKLCTLATVGTIGDAMLLRGDNRYIVQNGLKLMRNEKGPLGLQTLIEQSSVFSITETDVAFKIAPTINAAGRMLDDGASLSMNALVAVDKREAESLVTQLLAINERRKTSTTLAVEEVEGVIVADALYGDKPLVIYAEGLHEGLVGIVTGKLAEKYKVPTFVLTDSMDENVLKGSGRSFGGVNLKADILDKLPDGLLLHGGGHADAAGISVERSKFNEMVAAMQQTLADFDIQSPDTLEYDLEISADDVPAALREVKKYAPYGNGCPAPVFLVSNVVLSPKYGQLAKYMGKDAEHVKLHSAKFSAVCFGKSKEYRAMGCPGTVDLVGTLSENVWNTYRDAQVEVVDLAATKKTKRSSSLLDALAANGTI